MALNPKRVTRAIRDVTRPRTQPVIAQPDREKGEQLNWMGGISYDPSNPLTRFTMAAASCFFGEPSYYQGQPSDRRTPSGGSRGHRILTGAERARLRSVLNAVDPQEWRSLEPKELMERAIDEALDFDAEATLAFAVELRQRLHVRTTPQVIMVRAACHPKVKGTGLVTKYARQIMNRLDEVPNQLAYFLSLKAGRMPKSLERNWRRRIEAASQYEMAKYRMDRRAVKLTDVISMVHAKGKHSANPS